MRRSTTKSPSDQQTQRSIGWRTPEHLRIGSFTHPGGYPLPDAGRIPCLMLRGMWLDRFELPVGSRVLVDVTPKRVTITLDETPVPVPYRHQDHVPKRKKKGVAVDG